MQHLFQTSHWLDVHHAQMAHHHNMESHKPNFWVLRTLARRCAGKGSADSIAQVSAVQCGPYDYTRSGNPTRAQLEAHMADLEVRSQTFFTNYSMTPHLSLRMGISTCASEL